MTKKMNKDAFVNKLLALRVIIRIARGLYDVQALGIHVVHGEFTDRAKVCELFGTYVGDGKWAVNIDKVYSCLPIAKRISFMKGAK